MKSLMKKTDFKHVSHLVRKNAAILKFLWRSQTIYGGHLKYIPLANYHFVYPLVIQVVADDRNHGIFKGTQNYKQIV